MKTLLLDIETSPNTAFVWGLFDQNIPITAIRESSGVLCWSAKWLGKKEVMFSSVVKDGEKNMLKKIHKLLDEADAVIHYNGTRFDIPTLNKEFLLKGMTPPSPYRQIDLLRTMRSSFRFTSNKLDYVSQQLGIGEKTKHAGYQLWIDCMAKKPAAWKKMEQYNKQDVVLLEKAYERVRPWVKNHPNFNLYDGGLCCPTCGGSKYQARGVARTTTATYHRYQCITDNCGKWFRGDKVAEHVKPAFTGLN